MKPPVSLKDVAQAAGVSTITASRALRGLSLVTQATRTHVASIAEQLGYVPNLVASGLRSRRTGMILTQNITLAVGIKVVFFGLALAGIATMWMAVIADVGASLLVVGNGLRLARGAAGAASRPR